jgi:hypothetical protein
MKMAVEVTAVAAVTTMPAVATASAAAVTMRIRCN